MNTFVLYTAKYMWVVQADTIHQVKEALYNANLLTERITIKQVAVLDINTLVKLSSFKETA